VITGTVSGIHCEHGREDETERSPVMKKVITASVIVLLLAGSSLAALGDVFQTQEWVVGLNSTLTFTQGAGAASTNQNKNLFDSQTAGNVGLGTWGTQLAAGSATQTGIVAGNNIVGSAVQSLAEDGSLVKGLGQVQNIAPGGTIAESQGVAVVGTQDLGKAAGPGIAAGTNDVSLMMVGAGGNIGSNMANVGVLSGHQTSAVGGGPDSAGTVHAEMTGATSQVQQVN
jgi:hypothetical protein